MQGIRRRGREFRAYLRRVARYWLSRPIQTGARGATFAIGAGLVTIFIGILDQSTGADLRLSVFYMLPVAFATVACGSVTGLDVALISVAIGIWRDYSRYPDRAEWLHWTNGGFRLLIMIIVITLLSGLRAALDRAQLSEQRSREFLAHIAHQMRTPVAGIRTAVDSLIIQGVPPEHEATLQRIATESARSGRLIASLLRMARLDQGDVDPVRDCDIRLLVGEEVERVRTRAPHLNVTSNVQGEVPFNMKLSPEATQDALQNLLDNALKHAHRTVDVNVSAALDDELLIRVQDDGAGLAAGDERKVFDRFVSLDGRGGSGLGLPIARGLIERQGGRLRYKDGAFVIKLPLRN